MKQADVNTKLAAARTRLIIDKPFLGALVLRLPVEMADSSWCKHTATDAKKFYYNKEYIESLSLDQTQFILAHEALHCALSHFSRRQHRIKHRWDLACDFAINPLLIKDGLSAPDNALFMKDFEGMTAEEIYPYMDEFEDEEPLDQHIYDESDDQGEDPQGNDYDPPKESTPEKQQPQNDQSGSEPSNNDNKENNPSESGNSPSEQENNSETEDTEEGAAQPPPLSHQEKESLEIQWQQRMAGAAQSAMQAGKLDGEMARMVDFLLQPEIPWRALLARYMTATARDDYSYTRPSARRGDPFIFPSLRSSQIDIMVAVDTSGSISSSEMQEFISEIDSIKSIMRARIILHCCDSRLSANGPWTFDAWDEFSLPEDIQGGGGTSFIPIFEWAEIQDRQPDLLVYFTDADGMFPKIEPSFPVIWLVKGKHKTPWGQRVQLN